MTKHKVPHYAQTLGFTCGPACLLMSFKALDSKYKFSQTEELLLWKEATTIFMGGGHGGCGPHGLALSAIKRGYTAELYCSPGVLFSSSVRSANQKKVLKLLQASHEKELKAQRVETHGIASTEDWKNILSKNGVPIVLISTYNFDGSKCPHWVVILGIDGFDVIIHDPYVDEISSRINHRMKLADFAKMAVYGKDKTTATVAIFK